MQDVAGGITADSVLIGGASAHAAVAGNTDADTGGWTPGDTEAAKTAAEALGLAALLASFGGGSGDLPDIAGDMEDGYLSVVSRVLAGWDPEIAADELAGMLGAAVADGAYAEALTATQIELVAGQAALQWYIGSNVALLQWYAGPGACQICLNNAAADPRPPGVLWPGGVAEPLQHPNCGCFLAPPAA